MDKHTNKRKAVKGETPSPLDCKKRISFIANMADTIEADDTMSELEFVDDTPVDLSQKTDRELLELNFHRLSDLSRDVFQINKRQSQVLKKMSSLEDKVSKHDTDIIQIQTDVTQINQRLENIPGSSFNPEVTLVAINTPYFPQEDLRGLAYRILVAVGCAHKTIVAVKRTPVRQSGGSVVKIELQSLQDKIEVLRNKPALKQSPEFNRVYIRSSMSHEARMLHNNFKAVLQELPNGHNYRLTGSGKVISNSSSESGNRNYDNRNVSSNRGNNSSVPNHVVSSGFRREANVSNDARVNGYSSRNVRSNAPGVNNQSVNSGGNVGDNVISVSSGYSSGINNSGLHIGNPQQANAIPNASTTNGYEQASYVLTSNPDHQSGNAMFLMPKDNIPPPQQAVYTTGEQSTHPFLGHANFPPMSQTQMSQPILNQ